MAPDPVPGMDPAAPPSPPAACSCCLAIRASKTCSVVLTVVCRFFRALVLVSSRSAACERGSRVWVSVGFRWRFCPIIIV